MAKMDAEDLKDHGSDEASENARGKILNKKGSAPPWLQNAAKVKLASMKKPAKKGAGGFKPGTPGVNPFAKFAKK